MIPLREGDVITFPTMDEAKVRMIDSALVIDNVTVIRTVVSRVKLISLNEATIVLEEKKITTSFSIKKSLWQQPWKKSHGNMLFVRLMKLTLIGFSRGAMKVTNPSKSFPKSFTPSLKITLVAFDEQWLKQRGEMLRCFIF